jgi:hypothetical protein
MVQDGRQREKTKGWFIIATIPEGENKIFWVYKNYSFILSNMDEMHA